MGRGRKGIRTKRMVRIARERIDILHSLAEEEAHKGNLARSDRYVELAKRIGMRYNIRVPTHLKKRMCKGCGRYMLPGKTCHVRVRKGGPLYTCQKCNTITRYPRPGPRRTGGPQA